ncbi:MAG: hypothetical protein HY654_10680 [Acidobacteria bacterium]|nr:hypothetical protein [Acidobacteriota bacterium]
MGTRAGGIFALGVLIFGLAACSQAGSADTENQIIGISTSQLFVTVENRAGFALTEIKVNIVPVGRVTTFSTTWTRLEVSEKRDFSLGDFRSRDGTPLNLRVHRPQSVVVNAVGFNGEKYEVESSW